MDPCWAHSGSFADPPWILAEPNLVSLGTLRGSLGDPLRIIGESNPAPTISILMGFIGHAEVLKEFNIGVVGSKEREH